MDSVWVAKLLGGTITRGVMWALAGLCAYLAAKGIYAEVPEADNVAPVIEGVLAFVLPILASLWSARKNTKLLETDLTVADTAFTGPPAK